MMIPVICVTIPLSAGYRKVRESDNQGFPDFVVRFSLTSRRPVKWAFSAWWATTERRDPGSLLVLRRLTRSRVLHPLNSVLHQRRGAAKLQLLFNADAIRLDGLDIQVQLLRDLPRGQAMSYQLEHLKFAVSQLAKG